MMNAVSDINTIRSCILGHAVGDALGVPAEFTKREALDRNPVTGMQSGGFHNMPAGSWSDDTSMTLCALDSLSKDTFTWEDVMKNFGKWLYKDEFTPTGEMFDVGNACADAIDAYFEGKADLDHCGRRGERENGNGSLMRIIPFVLYAPGDLAFIEKASAMTHAHRRSQIACGIYALILEEILRTGSKDGARHGVELAKEHYAAEPEWTHFEPLLTVETRERDSIISGGYVVTSLEAALWCLLTTDSYAGCVLKAVNLGADTDTVAAIAGGLAGALYGLDGIPEEWLNALLKKDFIEELCEKAGKRWSKE